MAKKQFVAEKSENVKLIERVTKIALQPSSVVKGLENSAYKISSEHDGVITVASMGSVCVCIHFIESAKKPAYIDVDSNDERVVANVAAFKKLDTVLSNKSANMLHYMDEAGAMEFARQSAKGSRVKRNENGNQWDWVGKNMHVFVQSSDMFRIGVEQENAVIGEKTMLPTFGNMVPMLRLTHSLNQNYRIGKRKQRVAYMKRAALHSDCRALSLFASRCM